MHMLSLTRSLWTLVPSLVLCSSLLHAEVVINELMYHPRHANNTPEPQSEEFIELHNTDPVNAVDLSGWSFSSGLNFEFPVVSIPGGGYLIVAANPVAFVAKYPDVTTGVMGPWEGRLGNDGERIRLVDALRNEIDDIAYHDDGDWAVRRRGAADNGHRGWRWVSLADGGGASLELRNPSLSNKQGQNWGDSIPQQGTPGAPNSVATSDIAPIITDVFHHPALPTSTESVRIRAKLRDEQAAPNLTAKLHYRISSLSPSPFTTIAMSDNGLSDDELPNDGIFAATLPAHADGTVIEYYIEARDNSNARTWPGSTDTFGTQGSNALYIVEDRPLSDSQEVYRLVLSAVEAEEFSAGNFDTESNAQMNVTLIVKRGDDQEIRYRGGLRRRGAGSRNDNPRTMRLNLLGENPWDGVTALNLNSHFGYMQIFGHKLFAASGLAGGRGRSVKLVINGSEEAGGDEGQYGFYAHMEPQGGGSIERQFPDDSSGNLYRKRRPDRQLAYRDGDLSAYVDDGWSKNTNQADWDWSDLDALLGALNDTQNPDYLTNLSAHLDVEQWLRWFAVMTLLNNGETNISNGADDDYYIYRGVTDPRFKLIPHDLDTIFGLGDGSSISSPQNTIFDMFEAGGNGRAESLDLLEDLIRHPEILPRYYHHLRELVNTSFSKSVFDSLVAGCLDFVPNGQRANVISYMDQRRAYVLSVIDPGLTVETGLGEVGGFPVSAAPLLSSVSGNFSLLDAAAVLVNGQPAQIDRATGNWSFGGSVPVDLVPAGADWSYLDDGSDQGIDWRAGEFDDSAWSSGRAQFGYGDGDEETVVGFGGDPNNKFITTYFRHDFYVVDPSVFAAIQVLLQRDDGAAVYLNGVEIVRDDLEPDAAWNDPATDFVTPADEEVFHTFEAPANLLVVGTNTLAVEVHQFAADNPDLSFDLALAGLLPGPSISLDPGINRITVQALDAHGVALDSTTTSVWYDDAHETQAISGTLAANTSLTAAAGPYSVTGNLTVPDGITLTIEPGTTLFFGADTRLTVRGRLLAVGAEYRPITLTRKPGSGDTWDGVYFEDTLEDNRMGHVDQSFSTGSSQSTEVTGSRLVLDHVRWTGTSETVLEISRPQLRITNCVFPPTSGSEAIHGSNLSGSDYFILDGCFFNTSSGYNDIIDFSGGRRPGPIIQVRNNIFNGGTDDCLDLDGVDAHIEGNLFRNIHTDDPSRSSTSNAIATDGDAHITVVRNVFYDVDHALLLKNESDAIFENNVVVGATLGAINFREPLRDDVDAGSDIFASGNLFFNNAVTFRFPDHPRENGSPPNIVANSNLMPAADHVYGSGNLDADPGFLDPDDGDFRLLPSSPARGTGINGNDMGADIRYGALITGAPPAVSVSDSATLQVHIAGISGIESGSFVSEYRWRVNGGAWSADTELGIPITLTNLADGDHVVEAIAKDSAGNWQAEVEAASVSWTVDSGRSILRINEVLADNRTALENAGTFPDYVELYNDGSTAIVLTGMSLSDDPLEPNRFVFPPGMILGAGQYLTVYADSDSAAPGIHLGFGLRSSGESVTLFAADGSSVIDSVSFGSQVADLSIGRAGRDAAWGLNAPTPGAANLRMGTGDPGYLRINEWLAGSSQLLCDDFIELFNPAASPVALGGLFFTDDPGVQKDQDRIAPLSFIGASGFQVFWASGDPSKGIDHLSFKLNANAEWVGLYSPSLDVIDLVPFSGQSADVSVGLFPDGGTATSSYPLPTPGLTNSQTGQAVTQTIHLRRLNDVWSFEQSNTDLSTAWRDPGYDDSAWPSGAGLLYFENDDLPGPKNTPLTLGAPTYYFRSAFQFNGDIATTVLNLETVIDDGFVIYLNGESIFRIGVDDPYNHNSNATRTVGDADFEGPFVIPIENLVEGTNVIAVEVHQAAIDSSDVVFGLSLEATVTTPATPTPAFENALKLIGGLRVTELMFHPADGNQHEYIELRNTGTEPIDLAGVRFTEGIEFVFPARMLAPGEYVLVVSNLEAFELKYGTGLPVAGVYTGLLSNGGEQIVLRLPDPYEVNILKFKYDDSWYPLSDGRGHSLEITDFSAPISTWNSPAAWRSGTLQGSPGNADFLTAGINQIITYPSLAALSGATSATWAPGLQWSVFSGPGDVEFSAPTSLDTSASFSAPGSYVLRLVGQAAGLTLTSGVVVTVNDTYAAWQDRLGGVGGPFDNDDGDRLLNIEEYAHDRDPFLFEPDTALIPAFDEQRIGVEFLSYLRKTGVQVNLETSPDLIRWSRVLPGFVSGTADAQLLGYTLDPAAVPRAYFRLATSLPALPTDLVSHSGFWHYRKGTSEPPANWYSVADDALDVSWETGMGGFGYGDGDDRTVFLDMEDNYTVIYTRTSFEITAGMDPSRHLQLAVDYDDGCVVYLDGEEVFRSPNVPGAPGIQYAHDGEPLTGDHEAFAAGGGSPPALIDLGTLAGTLGLGTHVLAAQVINGTIDSSDVSLIVDLDLIHPPEPPEGLSWTLADSPVNLTSDFTLDDGSTLTIEAGVEVILSADVSLRAVNGSDIVIAGTDASPVVMRSAGGIDWGELSATSAGSTLIIRHADISGGRVRFLDGVTGLLEDSRIHDSGASSIINAVGASVTLRRCKVDTYGETLFQRSLTLIENCLFEAASGDAVDFDAGVPGSTIRQCTFRGGIGGNTDAIDIGPTGGVPSRDVVIEGCIMSGFSDKGVSIGDGPSDAENIIVRNCLIYDVVVGVQVKHSSTVTVHDCTIVDSQIGLHGFEKAGGSGGGIFTSTFNNILTGNATSIGTENDTIISVEYSNTLGSTWAGAGNIEANPLFHDPANGDYRLLPGSPCIGTGISGDDMGVTFPVGGLPDIPANLQVVLFDGSEAQLTWEDPDGMEEQFVIERSSDGAIWTDAAIVPADTTSATLSDLEIAPSWSFRIRGSNFLGNSFLSNPVTSG